MFTVPGKGSTESPLAVSAQKWGLNRLPFIDAPLPEPTLQVKKLKSLLSLGKHHSYGTPKRQLPKLLYIMFSYKEDFLTLKMDT